MTNQTDTKTTALEIAGRIEDLLSEALELSLKLAPMADEGWKAAAAGSNAEEAWSWLEDALCSIEPVLIRMRIATDRVRAKA